MNRRFWNCTRESSGETLYENEDVAPAAICILEAEQTAHDMSYTHGQSKIPPSRALVVHPSRIGPGGRDWHLARQASRGLAPVWVAAVSS